jgi:hypothetical protein
MIIEKLLPQELENLITKTMTDKWFNWNWNSEQIVPQTPDKDLFQLTHLFYYKRKVLSKHFNLMNTAVGYFAEKTGLKVKRVVRIKGNLLTNVAHEEESLTNLIHTDLPILADGKFISFVYYVIDSDGDTIIYDKDRNIVETSPPIKGNCVWLNSKTEHRSSPPVNHKRRIVINFILEVE